MRRFARSLVVVACFSAPAVADTPVVFPYAGYLLDVNDVPFNGTVELDVALFEDAVAVPQTPPWAEKHRSVSIRQGLYAIDLGSQTPIPTELLRRELWLELTVNGFTLAPRTRIGSTVRAETANDAVKLGGADASTFVRQGAPELLVGRLGVGLPSGSAPAATLHVGGRVLADGYDEVSDATLKRDVRPLAHVRDRLKTIRGVSYGWNARAGKAYGKPLETREIGVLAQDVEAAFPELVSRTGRGDRAVDYGRLSAVLVEAFKAQEQELDEMRAELRRLGDRVGR